MNTQNPPAEPIDVAEAGLRLAILDVLRRAQERCAGLVGTWPKGQALVNGQPRGVTITLHADADPVIDIYGDPRQRGSTFVADALGPPLRLVDRIEEIEAVVQQIVEEAQARCDAYAAAHAKITALRAKIGGGGAERVTAGERTAEMARQDPQPRDRWRQNDGRVYRLLAVDPGATLDAFLADWESEDEPDDERDTLSAEFFYIDRGQPGQFIGEKGETYLGVSSTLFGAP